MHARRNDTMMELTCHALLESLEKVCKQKSEAWQKLVKMYGAFDEVMDDQLKDNVQGIMGKSHITKCTACCLHLLSSVSSKEELRQMIQKGIQQLRLHQIKENQALPTALWQKVQLALVMRFKKDE
eukprot:3274929-Amphidinium_carterae.1